VSDAGVNLELLETSALIGSMLPVAVAVLKQDRFSRRANTAVAVGTTLAIVIMVVWLGHRLALEAIGVNFVVMYTAAVAFYHGLWRPTGIAPMIQRRTSRRRKEARTWTATAVRRPAGIVSGSIGSGSVERRTHDRDLARC
jgi:hypothetical protein